MAVVKKGVVEMKEQVAVILIERLNGDKIYSYSAAVQLATNTAGVAVNESHAGVASPGLSDPRQDPQLAYSYFIRRRRYVTWTDVELVIARRTNAVGAKLRYRVTRS